MFDCKIVADGHMRLKLKFNNKKSRCNMSLLVFQDADV